MLEKRLNKLPMLEVSKPRLVWVAICLACYAVNWLMPIALIGQDANENAIRSVAVVAPGLADDAIQDVLALTEAFLSENDQLQLVERSQIDKLLDEHQLALSGMVNAQEAIRVGEISRARVLVVLESDKLGERIESLIIYDTQFGVRLADTTIPRKPAEETAELLVEVITGAVAKSRQGLSDAKTVCVSSVRQTNVSADFDTDGRAVKLLVERGLTNLPGSVTLERSRLDRITQEKILSKEDTQSTDALLGSLLMIEVDLVKEAGVELIKANVHLKQYDGAQINAFDVEQSDGKLVELSNKITRQLQEMLSLADAKIAADPILEAQHLVRDSTELFQVDLQRAIEIVESAYALAPEDENVLRAAAQVYCEPTIGLVSKDEVYEIGMRAEVLTPGMFRKMHSALERSLFFRQAYYQQRILQKQPVLLPENRFLVLETESHVSYPGEKASYLMATAFERLLLSSHPPQGTGFAAPTTPEQHETIKELQSRYRSLEMLINKYAVAQVRDAQSFQEYTQYLKFLLTNVELFSPNAGQWAEDSAALLSDWLSLHETYGWQNESIPTFNLMIAGIMNRNRQLDRLGIVGQWYLVPDDTAPLKALFEKMAGNPDSGIAVLGKLGAIWLTCFDKHLNGSQMEGQIIGFIRDVIYQQQAIDAPQSKNPQMAQLVAYYAMLDASELFCSGFMARDTTFLHNRMENWTRARFSIFQEMVKRKHLVYGVAAAACSVKYYSHQAYRPVVHKSLSSTAEFRLPAELYPQLLEYIKQTQQLIADPATIALDDELLRLRGDMVHNRETIRALMQDEFEAAWVTKTPVFESREHPDLYCINTPLIQDERLIAVGFGDSDLSYPQGLIRVLEYNTKTGAQTIGPQIRCPLKEITLGVLAPQSLNFPTAIVENSLFIGTSNQGICVYNLTDQTHRWITIEENLPSESVQELVQLNGKVYALLGSVSGGFFVSIDAETLSLNVIASSVRSVQQTPLDNLVETSETIRSMLADPERNRVYFYFNRPAQVQGLWSFDPDAGQFEKLIDLGAYVIVLQSTEYGFLLTRAVHGRVSQHQTILVSWDGTKRALLAGPDTPDMHDVHRPGFYQDKLPLRPPVLFDKDWIWSGAPLARVSKSNQSVETFPYLNVDYQSDLLDDRYRRFADLYWCSLDTVDGGTRLIFANRDVIYLLNLRENARFSQEISSHE
jgi:hypothetical protein